ncbi:MAG: TetR/AcrR family transcriptional regulator [Oculatellaceae cyanobacterium Prado106]|jgi:AcrR family transcriptional regulator|nr:TetR/AcrR family transcriptional regulator [Oculatellaceae cyanobacterium Prado106]
MFCQGEIEKKVEKKTVDHSQKESKTRRKPQQARSQERVRQILQVAERLFLELGYEGTTTRAIATQAQIPVGSLYQFFPDKIAILQALGTQYLEQEYQVFAELHGEEALTWPLSVYVERVIDAFDQFYTAHPAYRVVFEQLRRSMPEDSDAIDEEISQGIAQDLAAFLTRKNPTLAADQSKIIGRIVVEVVGTLQWLSLGGDRGFQGAIVEETKKLMSSYLNLYFDPS